MSDSKTVECGACEGHGMGRYGGASRCSHCKGRGYFTLSLTEYKQYLEDTGETDPDFEEEFDESETEQTRDEKDPLPFL